MKRKKNLFIRIKFFKYQIRKKIFLKERPQKDKRKISNKNKKKSYFSFVFSPNLNFKKVEKFRLLTFKKIPFVFFRVFQFMQSLQVSKKKWEHPAPLVFFDTGSFFWVSSFFQFFPTRIPKIIGPRKKEKSNIKNFFQSISNESRKELVTYQKFLVLEKALKKAIDTSSFFFHLKILSQKNSFLEFNFLNRFCFCERKSGLEKKVKKSLYRNFIALFDFVSDF